MTARAGRHARPAGDVGHPVRRPQPLQVVRDRRSRPAAPAPGRQPPAGSAPDRRHRGPTERHQVGEFLGGRRGVAPAADPAVDGVDRLRDRHPFSWVPSRNRNDTAPASTSFPRQQQERHLAGGVGADLLLHPVVGVVDLGPDARGRAAARMTSSQVVAERVGDRDADHLHRRQPGRERAGVVLGQHPDEPLDGAELRRVDHHRLLPGAVGGLVFQAEPGRLVEVVLDGRHLPGAADRVPACMEIFGP